MNTAAQREQKRLLQALGLACYHEGRPQPQTPELWLISPSPWAPNSPEATLAQRLQGLFHNARWFTGRPEQPVPPNALCLCFGGGLEKKLNNLLLLPSLHEMVQDPSQKKVAWARIQTQAKAFLKPTTQR